MYEQLYDTLDIVGGPEVRAQATAKVSIYIYEFSSRLYPKRLACEEQHSIYSAVRGVKSIIATYRIQHFHKN